MYLYISRTAKLSHVLKYSPINKHEMQETQIRDVHRQNLFYWPGCFYKSTVPGRPRGWIHSCRSILNFSYWWPASVRTYKISIFAGTLVRKYGKFWGLSVHFGDNILRPPRTTPLAAPPHELGSPSSMPGPLRMKLPRVVDHHWEKF